MESIAQEVSKPDAPQLLSVAELARTLKMSRAWVYGASQRGDIPTVKLGRVRRFYLPDVLDALRKHGV